MYPPPPTMIVGNPKLLTNLAQFPCPTDVEARVSGNAGSGGTRLTMHGQVETTQLVTCERIGPALKDDGGRAVPIHDMLNHLPPRIQQSTRQEGGGRTGSKMLGKETSLMPSRSGTLTA